MTLPTMLLALLIGLFYGTFYHLIRGGGFWRLIFYIAMSLLGFVLGHLVGVWRGWVLLPIGGMNLGLSSMGSMLILVLGDWLSRVEVNPESKV